MRERTIPLGIMDAWWTNTQYSELVQELSIDSKANGEALAMITSLIKEYDEVKKQDPSFHLLEFNQDDSKLDEASHEDGFEPQVIYLYRTSKLSHAEIALRLDLGKRFVHAWIDQYKRNIKEWFKINKHRADASKTKINDSLVAKIKSFCVDNSGRVLTIDDIKKSVWDNSNDAKPPSNSTIIKTLKHKLRITT